MDSSLIQRIADIVSENWNEEKQELDMMVSTGHMIDEETGLYHGVIVFNNNEDNALYDARGRATAQEAQADAEQGMHGISEVITRVLGGEGEVETEVTQITAN